jgi:16S rRNA (cytosine1402-N4)-methyltransferase
MTEAAHDPVMVADVTAAFAAVPAGWVLDGTLGRGGHAAALLTAHAHLSVLGIDRDADAIAACSTSLAEFGQRIAIARHRFDDFEVAMHAFHIDRLSGAQFDYGVSSPQLDVAGRGFSFRNDGALDMRMDQRQPWSASDVVNTYDARQLASVLRRFADERFADRIANAIVNHRPIESTSQLAEIVVAAIPAAARRTGGHPAKRTFQAIRMEVNAELEAIEPALQRAIDHTVTGGRVSALSYHSGEDRIVKDVFARAVSGGCECPPELPCVCDAVQTVRIVKVAKRPSAAEQASNPRARSARLRVVEKIEPTPTRSRTR